MKLIKLDLNKEIIPFNGKYISGWGNKRSFDSFRISGFSGHRVYLIVISNALKIGEIAKKMEFEEGENKVYVKFGGQKVCIGTYCVG